MATSLLDDPNDPTTLEEIDVVQPPIVDDLSEPIAPVVEPPAIEPPVTPPAIEPPAAAAPTAYEVDPATQTVAGQLEGLLADDSVYIQRAEAGAAATAASRGLLNSSIAAGAGQAAAIDAALPIAQQDAQTYFAQANLNQNADNNFELFNTEFAYNDYFKDVDFANTTALNVQQNAAAMELQEMQDFSAAERLESQIISDEFLAAQADKMTRENITAGNEQQFTESISQLSQQYQQSYASIVSNDDMDTTAKTDAINQLRADYESQFNFFGDMFDLEIDFVLPNVDINGDTISDGSGVTVTDQVTSGGTTYDNLSDGTVRNTDTGEILDTIPTPEPWSYNEGARH
jgi:hypothetical protein